VEHHELVIARQTDIELDPGAAEFGGAAKTRERILRRARRGTAMADDPWYKERVFSRHREVSVPLAKANGIELAYEDIGERGAPAILLIMGLGAQLTRWPDAFCGRLADAGFRVVRYDNRDSGLSTKFAAAGAPNMAEMFQRALKDQPVDAPYTLEDMARDGVGLMDALGIAKAHIVGASMGGMIAQMFAANHPDRTRSLVSIMSTSGRPGLPPAKPEAMAVLVSQPPASDRESIVAYGIKGRMVVGSPGFPEDAAVLRRLVEEAYDRSYYPQGTPRQTAAILKSGSRVALLENIRVPSLVIHGIDDPLVPVECGKDTAAAIPDCELLLVPGMGHAIEAGLVPTIADAIVAFCRKVSA
jgi:pimeloyl-ACP methyl ester carboxylesterase